MLKAFRAQPHRLRIRLFFLMVAILPYATGAAQGNTIVRVQTVLGDIEIELFDSVAPLTVQNFLNYVNDADYDRTFIHRSVPGFVIQGGGFWLDAASGAPEHIVTDPPVANEFSLSNLRGTVAMAKLGGDPDSATSEWFINLADNSGNLDTQNGGFTVFGQVINNGMAVADAIAGLPRVDAGGAFDTLPVIDYQGGAIGEGNLVRLTAVSVIGPREDAVVNFGDLGLWARMNDSGWLKLNNNSPEQLIVGDMDGNDADDVVAVFNTGIFVKRNLGAWAQLHNSVPELMAIGDLDGNAKDDLVVDFGGIGLWARMNDTSWLKLNNSSPDLLAVGDLDGNGWHDVIADFGSTLGGIFVKRNQGAWVKLHNSSAEALMVGDLDNSGRYDLIVDFGTIGLWARMNDSAWLKLHNASPDLVATGDLDANGADDVMATFTGLGLWQKLNLGGWSKLNNNAPDVLVSGDVNGSGQQDIVADFGSTLGGIFVKRDQGTWVKLHNSSSAGLAAGNLDGR